MSGGGDARRQTIDELPPFRFRPEPSHIPHG